MKVDAMKRLKELEKENARLKKIVADQAVDIDILKEVSRETSEIKTRRRAAVEHVRRRLGISEHRACRVIALSRENPRYSYRRVWALLRREGWLVNKKRVHRLWRKEGLKVVLDKQRKRRRLPILLGTSEDSCTRRQATHPNHVWSNDFVMDLTEDGRRLKMMLVVDEYSRECLSIDVERSITAEDVVSTLASLFRQRGAPAFIRSDNGPEFIAKTIKIWLKASGVKTLYIEPGSLWENAYLWRRSSVAFQTTC